MGTENERVKSPIVRCTHHYEQGHFTTACKPFKGYLEQLVAAGHLNDPINCSR